MYTHTQKRWLKRLERNDNFESAVQPSFDAIVFLSGKRRRTFLRHGKFSIANRVDKISQKKKKKTRDTCIYGGSLLAGVWHVEHIVRTMALAMLTLFRRLILPPPNFFSVFLFGTPRHPIEFLGVKKEFLERVLVLLFFFILVGL